MARLSYYVNSGEVTMVSATAKSILQVKAPTNQRLVIWSLKMFGKQSAGGTDAVGKVRMTRSTANFGTFTGATPNKVNPSNGETIQATCGSNASAEPTAPTDGGLWYEIQPQSGIIENLPLDKPIEIPGGQSVQFEVTVTGTPVLMMTALVEE